MSDDKGQLETGLQAFAGLLDEFRSGNIADKRAEERSLEIHLRELSARWGSRFPGFPQEKCSYASLRSVRRRGVRDEYLKNIIVRLLDTEVSPPAGSIIVNPVCVFGRHARDVASRLPHFKVIATDVDPRFNWLYEHILRRSNPDNYEFTPDNIFDTKLKAAPRAVMFFGACGSLSDAAMDYALETDCPYLICRTCCHDNIGGNTTITKRFNALNLAFRLKNLSYARKREKATGEYFSQKYSMDQYPRSEAARGLSNSGEFAEVSRNSVDSDICRAIIDLDRYLRLVENQYDAWYKGELFVARKND
jgi:hypothetical protein